MLLGGGAWLSNVKLFGCIEESLSYSNKCMRCRDRFFRDFVQSLQVNARTLSSDTPLSVAVKPQLFALDDHLPNRPSANYAT